ncbi:MAG: hypothetical protein JNK82_10695, partial [Myxococcaceae bacterium]|nr:hypothetical protein [Myxococcaceae bacterium]
EVRITGAASLAKKWKAKGLCPRARAEGHDLVLSCTNDRLHATSSGGTVTIVALRGLPWAAKDEPAPRRYYKPEEVGLGGACPGTTPAGKAECAFAAGDVTAAKTFLNAALDSMHRDYAAVRMADLALDADCPLDSMEWLEKVGRTGDWGRLASVRQCELSGRCFKGPQREALFDSAGMPLPMREELKLRELRLLRYESPVAAATRLFDAGRGSWPEALCAGAGTAICHNVMFQALESNDVEARIAALTLYASGPVSTSFARRPWLADAAADAAVALGAPQYAASALAAATADVKKPELKKHLLRVIALYELAGEPARAAAVRAYAIDSVGLKPSQKAKKVSKENAKLAQREAFEPRDAELAAELANAAVVRSRARAGGTGGMSR